MAWSVSAPTPDLLACRLTFTGAVSSDDMTHAFEQTARVCLEHDVWRVLTDASAMTASHTVIDVYTLVTSIADLGVQDRFREALVSPIEAAARENVRFWEDAAVNRGLSCKVFATESAAVAWLLS
jgi:hypothetical protein